MPRLLGVEIPSEKRIEASLTYIYGIGPTTAKRILDQTNIDPNLRAQEPHAAAAERHHPRDHRQQAVDRRRSAPRAAEQPEAPAGDQLLSRHPASPRPSRARPAHLDKRAHAQGTAQDCRRHPQQGREGRQDLSRRRNIQDADMAESEENEAGQSDRRKESAKQPKLARLRKKLQRAARRAIRASCASSRTSRA